MLRSIAARIALACALLIAFGARAAAPAPVSTVNQADVEIARRLDHRLDTEPALARVESSVVNGVALLHGEVVAQDDVKLAESIASQTKGVERVENRIELSTRLRDRFAVAFEAVGEKLVRLVAATPLLILAIAIIFLFAWIGRLASRRSKWWLGRLHSPNPYMEGLVQRIVQWLVMLAGVLIALDLLGASSLVGAVLGSAGVAGLVLGFAFKDIAENYVAGILLSLRRPFSPGDHVLIDRVHEGRVVALTSRATLLMTMDGNQIALPNALVFRSVVLNFSENPKRRFDFLVPLDPSASVGEAQRAGLAALQTVDGVLADPPPSSLIVEYLHDRLNLQYLGWVDQTNNSVQRVRSESMRVVKRALDDHHVRRAGTPEPDVPMAPAMEAPMHADTSADKEIDAQLAKAQQEKEGENLLDDKSPSTPS